MVPYCCQDKKPRKGLLDQSVKRKSRSDMIVQLVSQDVDQTCLQAMHMGSLSTSHLAFAVMNTVGGRR